jgi:hypothetical protein
VAHVLQQRPLEVQPGLLHHLLHLAELEHDRVLALVDGEERARRQENADHEERQYRAQNSHERLPAALIGRPDRGF